MKFFYAMFSSPEGESYTSHSSLSAWERHASEVGTVKHETLTSPTSFGGISKWIMKELESQGRRGRVRRDNMHRHALCVRNYCSAWDGYASGSSANKFEKEPEPWHWLSWTCSYPHPLLTFFNWSTQNPKSSQILFLAGQKMYYWQFKVLWEIKTPFSRQLYHKDPALHIGLHLKY